MSQSRAIFLSWLKTGLGAFDTPMMRPVSPATCLGHFRACATAFEGRFPAVPIIRPCANEPCGGGTPRARRHKEAGVLWPHEARLVRRASLTGPRSNCFLAVWAALRAGLHRASEVACPTPPERSVYRA
jgi:hypothetical protein